LINVQGSGMGKKRHSSEPVLVKALPSENPTEHYYRSVSTGSQTSLQTGSSQSLNIDQRSNWRSRFPSRCCFMGWYSMKVRWHIFSRCLKIDFRLWGWRGYRTGF
jgi:hypothetical protein